MGGEGIEIVRVECLISMRNIWVFFRRYPAFSAIFLLCCVISILPVWLVQYVPFLDWPQHVGMVAFLRYQHDPLWGFATYAVTRGEWAATYVVFYYLSAWLAYLMPVEAACKVVLCLYMVGTPAAGIFLLRSMRIPPWAALLLFVPVYNWPLFMGFFPYVQSFPFLLLGLGLMIRLGRQFRWQPGLALIVVTLLLFWSHVFAYLVFGYFSLLILCFWRFRNFTQRWKTSLLWIPSLLLMAKWMHVLLLARSGGPALQQIASGDNHPGSSWWQATYRPWVEKLQSLVVHFNEAYHGDWEQKVFWFWVACLVWLLVVGLLLRGWRHICGDVSLPWPWWQAGMLLFATLLLYFAMPMGLFGVWWALSPRLVVLLGLIAIVCLPPLFVRQSTAVLLYLPVLWLSLWHANMQYRSFRAFDQEARPVNQVLQALPYGARVYGLIFSPWSRVTTEAAYMHFPVYALVQRGGMVGFSHFHYAVMPARFRNIALAPYPGHRAEWEPWRWRYDIYGPFYDYLVVKGYGFWNYNGGDAKNSLQTVVQYGDWSLLFNPKASQQWPLFAFRENLYQARVFQKEELHASSPSKTKQEPRSQSKECRRVRGSRFECPYRGWMVVHPAQVHLGGVHIPCIWAHPATGKTTEISFSNLPTQGNRILGILGIADSGFPQGRHQYGEPVDLLVRMNGLFVQRLRTTTHKGYTPYEIKLPQRSTGQPLHVSFEISTKNDSLRHFCFTATLFQSYPSP